MTMRILRWLAIVPGAFFAWYLVFVVGVFTYPMFESAICPPAEMISGMCADERIGRTLDLLIYVYVGVSAVAVVSAAVAIAPSRKTVVAWLAFVAGSTTAIVLALLIGTTSEAVVAIVAGLAAAYVSGQCRKTGSDRSSPRRRSS